MLNLAHRGFSGKYPENTMLAFEEALKVQGCDGIEHDVHMTRDGEIVIIHDEEIDRTCTNGTGFVKDLTLAELQKLDFSNGMKLRPEKIPTLREYFDLVKDQNILTNIELKTGVYPYPGIEETVLKLIREYKLEEQVIISSFNHFSVRRFKDLAPEIKCGFLSGNWEFDMGEYCRKHGVECFHPMHENMTEEHFADLKEAGIEVNVWTVNTEAQVKEMLRVGVNAVIGNFPDMASRVIAEA